MRVFTVLCALQCKGPGVRGGRVAARVHHLTLCVYVPHPSLRVCPTSLCVWLRACAQACRYSEVVRAECCEDVVRPLSCTSYWRACSDHQCQVGRCGVGTRKARRHKEANVGFQTTKPDIKVFLVFTYLHIGDLGSG